MTNIILLPSVKAVSAELSPEFCNINNEVLFARATKRLLDCHIKPWLITSRLEAVAILKGLVAA